MHLTVVAQRVLGVPVLSQVVEDVSAGLHRQSSHHHAAHQDQCAGVHGSPCCQHPWKLAPDVFWQLLQHPVIIIMEAVVAVVLVPEHGARERGNSWLCAHTHITSVPWLLNWPLLLLNWRNLRCLHLHLEVTMKVVCVKGSALPWQRCCSHP